MVTFYGSSLLNSSVPPGEPLEMKGAKKPGLVTKNGLVLFGNDGKAVSVQYVTYKITFFGSLLYPKLLREYLSQGNPALQWDAGGSTCPTLLRG